MQGFDAVSVSLAFACFFASACYAKTAIDVPTSTVKIARLQSTELPAAQVPLEIKRWLTSGASGVPSELLPYGIVPTGTPIPHYEDSATRFDTFHVNEAQSVDDALGAEFLKWVQHAGGGDSHADCMYPEFGLSVVNSIDRASVLISLSCGKIQVIANHQRREETLTMEQERAFVALAKRAFHEDIVRPQTVLTDPTTVTKLPIDGGAP